MKRISSAEEAEAKNHGFRTAEGVDALESIEALWTLYFQCGLSPDKVESWTKEWKYKTQKSDCLVKGRVH